MSEPFVRRDDCGFTWGGGDGAEVTVTRMAEFPRDNGVCRIVGVEVGGQRLQVYVSPKGRSVRVWLDGKELTP